MPAFAHGTYAPTAKNLDCTATPSSPVSGSRATIENVMSVLRFALLRNKKGLYAILAYGWHREDARDPPEVV